MSGHSQRPSAEQYQAAAALRAALRRFDQASERMLRCHGLTRERYELLLAIKGAESAGAPTTVSELTSALGSHR